MSATPFPNATQIPRRLSTGTWQVLRAVVLAGALALAGALVVSPDDGLFVLWRIVIPVLPLLWLVAPGLWRNLCPLASSNQTPRLLHLSLARPAPEWLKEYGFLIGAGMFVAFISARKLGLDDSGPLSGLLLLGAMAGGFVGGVLLKGKAGWCSSICPLLPIQRLYGQTPLKLVANTHCEPCVGCVKSCYDFNPRVAYLADLNDPDEYWRGYRKIFAGLFPGLVVAFFELPEARGGSEIASLYGHFALYLACSVAVFFVLDSLLKVSTHKVTTLFAATGFSLFYWYGGPLFANAVTGTDVPDAAVWAIRATAIGLAFSWLVRTYRKELLFLREQRAQEQAQQQAPVGLAGGAAQRTRLSRPAIRAGVPEVRVEPEGRRLVPKPGMSLLEAAEAGGLPIEAGCRMGMCGADAICVTDGMDNLSEITDEERGTLERLGLAPNTRLACCATVRGPVAISLTPEKPKQPSRSRIAAFRYDADVRRVVVVGNGIAGVTAADHVRRRHPHARIDVVAAEAHHLYNRMGIARLVYGRSAMQGLQLNPDGWYEEREITAWLNTRAAGLDRRAREVILATGEVLPYDRLILATGAESFVPSIDGVGAPGSFALRTADDALALRGYAQEHGARRAVVAGGGLLGLEAAYALHKLGLRTTVLERGAALLRRQLDARAAAILQEYLEGLGLEILTDAETRALEAGSRVRAARLADGRAVPADVFLVAAGIAPNAGLARDAGLEVRRGVLVDDRMRTSDPRILAAGDVAEPRHGIAGLWPVAVEQAEVAADNAVGGSRAYLPSPPVTLLKVVGIDLASVGRFEAGPGDEEHVDDPGDGTYRKLVSRGGRLVGAILLGHGSQTAAVRDAVARGARVEELDPVAAAAA